MKKKILCAVTAITCLIVLAPFTANAERFGDIMYYENYLRYQYMDKDDDGTFDYIEITGCDKSAETADIPAEIDGMPVKCISASAFYDCSSLKNVTIPEGVISIELSAFGNCPLESITIPDSVENIGDYAFNGTPLLENQADEKIKYVDSWVIKGDTDLTSAEIKEGTKGIADKAFSGCMDLINITLPDSLTIIGATAFSECFKLTEITLPDELKIIGGSSFYKSGLTSLTIPESVTDIGTNAFYGCYDLTGIDVSENNVSYISEDGVLFNKEKTELIRYPAGNERTEYIVPDSVTSFAECAFSQSINLKKLTLSENLTSIGFRVFSACGSLTDINIPDSVTSIKSSAFEYCGSLTGVIIPQSVTSIEWGAFRYCESLTNINIPSGVTSIKTSTFEGCADLTGILIPYSVTGIDAGAFSYCDSLTNVLIPDSVESIDRNAFEHCKGLESITIENPECKIYDAANTICNGYNYDYYFNGVIRGYENSTAQEYAEKYGYKFEAIGDGHWSILDLVELQKYIIKAGMSVSKRYDLNSDEAINVIDAVLLRRKLIYD
ncbi:MAG: leucine-rich repeat protein [Clostridium sp.]|nr:leucine-rich repeat protein [Clostridium sp.]